MNPVKVGPHLLFNDLCENVLPFIEYNSVDAVVCDPPYGTTLNSWDRIIDFAWMWPQLREINKGRVVLFGSQPFTSKLLLSNPKKFSHEIIWHKTITGNPFLSNVMPLKKHENILVFGNGGTYNPQMEKGEAYSRDNRGRSIENNNHKYGAKVRSSIDNKGTRCPSSVQLFAREWSRQQQIHPTQKPVALMCWLVATYTNPGDIVLDFSAGVMSTGIACAYLGRTAILIEKEKKFFDLGHRRMLEAHAAYLEAKKHGNLRALELHRNRVNAL